MQNVADHEKDIGQLMPLGVSVVDLVDRVAALELSGAAGVDGVDDLVERVAALEGNQDAGDNLLGAIDELQKEMVAGLKSINADAALGPEEGD